MFKLDEDKLTFIKKRCIDDDLKAVLLYSGERDGFTARAFHNLCDKKSRLLTLIKTNYGKVFGCYIHIPLWD